MSSFSRPLYFTGVESSPQVGWIAGCGNKIDDHACDEKPWTIPQCVDAKPGTDVGMVGGNGKGELLTAWVNAGNAPVRVPLFSCYNCDTCTETEKYKIGGFGCFKLDPAKQWDKSGYKVPSLSEPGQTCTDAKGEDITIAKVIYATVDCTCTISCVSAGGLPGPDDATIPVLFQ